MFLLTAMDFSSSLSLLLNNRKPRLGRAGGTVVVYWYIGSESQGVELRFKDRVKIVKQRMSLSKDFKAPSFQFRREESSNKIRKLLKYFSFMFSVLCSKMMSKFFIIFKIFTGCAGIPFCCVVIGC